MMQTIYSVGGASLFSFYIVYDTQLITGGSERKIQYTIDDIPQQNKILLQEKYQLQLIVIMILVFVFLILQLIISDFQNNKILYDFKGREHILYFNVTNKL